MRLPLNYAAAMMGLPGNFSGVSVRGVCIDSREVKPGCLFACLKGEKSDGHDFAVAAEKAGAAAVLAARPLPDVGVPVLVANDVIRALGTLARRWRDGAKGRVVCVTGTAGKTTLKEMLAAILRRGGSVAVSEKNHNNQLGLPLSLLAAEGTEDFWVMEAGISRPGDMEELAEIVAPDVAVILNVGAGHCEGLGEKGVAWHKTRLLEKLSPGGLALAGADYPELVGEVLKIRPDATFFSAGADSEVPYRLLNDDGAGNLRLFLNGEEFTASLPGGEAYPAETVLAACATATLLGLSPTEIKAGLRNVRPLAGRFSVSRVGGWDIIDDTYNANPLSMKRSLEGAGEIAKRRGSPLVLALGYMGELGDESRRSHRELGQRAAALKPARFFWKGDFGGEIGEGYGAKPTRTDDAEEFTRAASELISSPEFADGGVILLKGSRANKLEGYAKIFRDLLAGEKARVL